VDWHARFTQQARWTQELRRYLFERVGLSPGQRLLEVGCGTGAVLSTLLTAGCRLHGLDINRDFLHQAGQNFIAPAQRQGDNIPSFETLNPNFLIPNPAFLTQADAHHLPYRAGSFDIACCHFLLLWVVNPTEVIREMYRVTRPGGWVLALAEPDYGGRIDYPESLIQLGTLQEAALRRQGAEPRLGRQLGALFHAAGLAEVETGLLGGQWRQPPSPDDLAQEWAVLQSDLRNEITQAELMRLQQIDNEAWQHGERVLFVPTFYALGQKK
jgi:ubiquinone/menaquinone biosynthesis C-methylase UbiE